MSEKIDVSIAGGSGYAGGELLRILLDHPSVEIHQVTSRKYARRSVYKAHPNLRGKTDLKFTSVDNLEDCDTIFLCLPHGKAMEKLEEFEEIADYMIDLSADFRLNDPEQYEQTYDETHDYPESLSEFVYGIPELHRSEMKEATHISSAGCNATASILALFPLYREKLVHPDRTVVDVKAGSSEGGKKPGSASHHPERSGCVRTYAPTSHRHGAEIHQELGGDVYLTATAIEMRRGVLATCHVFPEESLTEKDLWKLYTTAFESEPFLRIVKERRGIHRYPEPKLVAGTNYCDVGFAVESGGNRVVVVSAIDNLVKGAAGQAVQSMNILHGFDETAALEDSGLHP